MDNGKMWQAVKGCDASFDGRFFYAVKTAGIYCRPSCKSKLRKRDNVVFFAGREDAERAGYRPCRHCRPDLAPARCRQIFASNISCDVIDTPIGGLRIIASDDAILCVEQTTRKNQEVNAQTGKAPDDQIMPGTASGESVKACEKQLQEYFSGERQAFSLPVKPEGTDFQKTIWRHLQDIPYGETCTYGELATMAGNSKASRAVGMANHCNPILILIPCHRVVASGGSLTGYAAGIEAKKYLLSMEKKFTAAKISN